MLAFASEHGTASEPCRRVEMASSRDLPKIEPARHLACFVAVMRACCLGLHTYWSNKKLESLDIVPALWFMSVATKSIADPCAACPLSIVRPADSLNRCASQYQPRLF